MWILRRYDVSGQSGYLTLGAKREVGPSPNIGSGAKWRQPANISS